jgi:hypothetical protein
MADGIRIQIGAQPEDLEPIQRVAANHGVTAEAPIEKTDQEQEEFGIFAVVVLIGAGLAVAKVVSDLWERWRGGMVIDLTQTPPSIRRSHDIQFGYIVTLTRDGNQVKASVDTKDEPKDAIERLAEAVLKLPVDATVETVKAAIEKATGGTAKVDPAPKPAT